MKYMVKFGKLVMLVLLVVCLQYYGYGSKAKDVGWKYPPFIFKARSIDGGVVDLSKYVGKRLLVVNFWASWCPPCKYEIPDLINLQEEFSNDILLVGVSVDRNLEDVKIISQKYKFNYPIVHDSDGGITQLYGGIYSIPVTFIIGYDGKIVERIVGARSFDVFKSYILRYLRSSKK
ncbi:MAG: TlpA disulfide reductase family protein [Brevinematia bacterium]